MAVYNNIDTHKVDLCCQNITLIITPVHSLEKCDEIGVFELSVDEREYTT